MLIVGAVLLGGCEARPTESEFSILKQAEKSLEEWALVAFDALKNGGEFPSKSKAHDILDGAIIRSPVGKSIRSNMQEATALIQMARHNLEEAQRLSTNSTTVAAGEADLSVETFQLISSIKERKANEMVKLASAIDALMEKIVTLEKRREEMFQQMRRYLEE